MILTISKLLLNMHEVLSNYFENIIHKYGIITIWKTNNQGQFEYPHKIRIRVSNPILR